jgi:sterol desaturase/sphingolipid hydroxylase (fatty acid hydroxylase superfamily)
MSKKYKSIRIFESDTLEKLTHVRPIVPLVVWVPIVAYFAYISFSEDHLALTSVVVWMAAGLFIWTLAEYLLHRYVFHLPGDTPFKERLQFIIHGLHHDDPNDPTRLVMPPAASLILGAMLFSIFRAVLGGVYVDPFFAGFLIGYLCYDYTHYAIHHFTPRTRFGKMVKQNHMAHHFIGHETRWGVSSPVWDYVFGTMEEVKRVRHGS